MENEEVKKACSVGLGENKHLSKTHLLFTTFNSVLGIIYVLYDSTAVLGMDNKKIHTVK